jgi:hypothetical protein
MLRITFYTNNLKYMGWEKLSNSTLLHLKNWINSGNFIKANGIKINTIPELTELYLTEEIFPNI